MGFLERLMSSQSSGYEAWKQLTEISQLDEIDKVSAQHSVVIFKHSTSCGISAGAKHRLEMDWSEVKEEVEFYFLDLLSYRHISDHIVTRYKVRHQSPQILVIKNGIATYNTSHHRINVGSILEAVL